MLYLNGQLVPTTLFPDNTSQVWKLPETILSLNNHKLLPRFATVKWEFSNEGEFMQLAQLKDLLDQHEVLVNLEIPYLPYGRQDKEISNTATFALHTFAKLLNSLQFHDILILDPHSPVALELIENSWDCYPYEELASAVAEVKSDIVCYPDKGAREKYSKIYRYPYIYGEKVRDQLTGNITSYQLVGECKDLNVVICDDLCDGGATFKILAKDLLAAGAKSVVLFVSHGIFSKGVRTLFESGIQRIFTADGEVSESHDKSQI